MHLSHAIFSNEIESSKNSQKVLIFNVHSGLKYQRSLIFLILALDGLGGHWGQLNCNLNFRAKIIENETFFYFFKHCGNSQMVSADMRKCTILCNKIQYSEYSIFSQFLCSLHRKKSQKICLIPSFAAEYYSTLYLQLIWLFFHNFVVASRDRRKWPREIRIRRLLANFNEFFQD